MKKVLSLVVFALGLAAGAVAQDAQVVNIYSHRHYDADKLLFKKFTEMTGIKVNVVQAKADELIERLRAEGAKSPADLLITVDAGRLYRAKSLGLLGQTVTPTLAALIPADLRDAEGKWVGLTTRSRVVVYDKTRLKAPEIKTYLDLANPKFKGQILSRSATSEYNVSLMASLIANLGADKALAWAKGVVANFAREPQGSDRDQMKALAAGTGSYALVNTYYLGLLLTSVVPEEVEVGKKMGVIFPDQKGLGAHINLSGAAVTANAPHRANALKLVEFLASEEAQKVFAEANFEYPANPKVKASELIAQLGAFKADAASINKLGPLAAEASKVFDQAGWR